MTGNYRIENDGFFTFPLLERVQAAGRTLKDLQTFLEALALAGSPTPDASNEVIVVHPAQPGQAEGDQICVNRRDLEPGRAGVDVVLHDGTINVPTVQRFYVDDARVQPRPRAFFFRDLVTDASYKASVLIELLNVVIGVAAFFYLSRVIDDRQPAGYDASGSFWWGLRRTTR